MFIMCDEQMIRETFAGHKDNLNIEGYIC
ncbi:hypothetical protein BPJM79_10237 [Bacillus pumilus]